MKPATIWARRLAPLVVAAAAAGFWWFSARHPSGVPARLMLHASRKGDDGAPNGPSRFIVQFPGAEARVDSRDYLQLAYDGLRAPAYATVVAIDEGGAEHQYVPGPDAAPTKVASPAGELGTVYLGRQRPGRFRLFAVFAPAPVEARAIREAAARAAARGQPDVLDGLAAVSGSLVIDP